MKINLFRITQFGVALSSVLLAASVAAQSPRQVPPVNQPGSQYASSPSAKSGNSKTAAGSLSSQDRDFMKKAAEGGMKEVDMGQMAEQQGKSDAVKSFGKRMVTDHSKANSELMALANKKGVQLGNKKPKMEKMSGADFDKEYMAAMVKDHETDLAEFQREASSGSDADVKAFAAKTAKVIQKHLELAKADQAKLK